MISIMIYSLMHQKSTKYLCCSFDGMLGVSADSAYLSKYYVSVGFLILGTQGGGIFLAKTAAQSTPLNHLCAFTSSGPF